MILRVQYSLSSVEVGDLVVIEIPCTYTVFHFCKNSVPNTFPTLPEERRNRKLRRVVSEARTTEMRHGPVHDEAVFCH